MTELRCGVLWHDLFGICPTAGARLPHDEYHLVTEWRLDATAAEVAAVFRDTPAVARWWAAAFEVVDVPEPGDADAVGRVVRVRTHGRLPYSLCFAFRVTESRYPIRFALAAWGDFEGRGVCAAEERAGRLHIRFDWRVRVRRPLVRALSVVLKPLFAGNHRWVMRRGHEGLARELARRRSLAAPSAARAERGGEVLGPG